MKTVFLTLITILLFSASSAMAGDVAAGKAKSALCAACHGATGNSVILCGQTWLDRKRCILPNRLKPSVMASVKTP